MSISLLKYTSIYSATINSESVKLLSDGKSFLVEKDDGLIRPLNLKFRHHRRLLGYVGEELFFRAKHELKALFPDIDVFDDGNAEKWFPLGHEIVFTSLGWEARWVLEWNCYSNSIYPKLVAINKIDGNDDDDFVMQRPKSIEQIAAENDGIPF